MTSSQKGNERHGRRRRRRRGGRGKEGTPKQLREEPEWRDEPVIRPPMRYGVRFYDTFQAAKADLDALREESLKVDQLNVVIRAEGNMDDPELAIERVKVFAGAAWTLIHERRKQEGWYDEPH